MADIHTTKTRSYNMSRVKSKNTSPELLIRKFLFSKGFRYRLYNKNLPGKPDITLPKYNTVIFINGCFWHGHSNCKYSILPETRKDFWENKISGNIVRDSLNIQKLKASGWNVITIFTCELKPKQRNQTLENLINELKRRE